MAQSRFKIDANASNYFPFAVYKRSHFLGIPLWHKVYSAISVYDAKQYMDEVSRLPVYSDK